MISFDRSVAAFRRSLLLPPRNGTEHTMSDVSIVSGDLLEQDVEVIVNAWNCNLIPWWLLVPSGVSGALRKRGGASIFREVRRAGYLKPGSATVTGAGRLPFRAVIHVAGLDLLWRSSEPIVRSCVRSALRLAGERNDAAIAFPLIGSGVGGLSPDRIEQVISDAASSSDYDGRVVIVRHARGN